MKVLIQCKNCNKDHYVDQREINRGNGKYCSRECSSKSKRGKSIKIPNCRCSNCKKEIYKNNSKKKGSKSGLYFCCRKCKDEAQRLGGISEIQPNHYGTGNHSNTYRKIIERAGLMKECAKCGYNKIIEILQVHHKDRNRNNNTLSNLETLCPTCHLEDHYLNNDGIFTKHKGERECKVCSSVLQTE